MSDKKYTVEFTEDELLFLVCFHGQSSADDWRARYLNKHDTPMIEFITGKVNNSKDTNSYLLYRKLQRAFLNNYKIPELSIEEIKQKWIDAINSGDTELSLKDWTKTSGIGIKDIKTKFGVIYND